MNTAARMAVARDKRSGCAARTEHRARCAGAETRARIGTLAALHQHQHHDAHRAEHAGRSSITYATFSLRVPVQNLRPGSGGPDGEEFLGLERSATDQATIDIRHAEQLRGIAGLARCRRRGPAGRRRY